MFKIPYRTWLLFGSCVKDACCAGVDSFDFDLIDMCKIGMNAATSSLNCFSLSNSPGSQQALDGAHYSQKSCPDFLNTLEDKVVEERVSLLDIDASTSTNMSARLSTLSTQAGGNSAKRMHHEAEKNDEEQKVPKKQRTELSGVNPDLMDGEEARMAIENFKRRFGKHKKVMCRTPPDIIDFAEDLARRGLTSMHSREIMEHCTASEQWLEHKVFWRMLIVFIDTLSLEIATLNRLDEKKTVFLRIRNRDSKPLSECTDQYRWNIITKSQDAKRMEIECSLNFLEGKGLSNVLSVLRWLLYHINIRYIGISCDLREVGMNSALLGRQMADLIKEKAGSRAYIDSLALHFTLAQYKDAAVIVKECHSIPVLKIHFTSVHLQQNNEIDHILRALLSQCLELENLSVFGVSIDIRYILTIMEMLPQLVCLEINPFVFDKKVRLQVSKPLPVFPCLRALKIFTVYSYSFIALERVLCFFPNLKYVQIPAKNVAPSLIDALSKMPLLRSLEIINGTLSIESAESLLEKLSSLECLSIGVEKLDNKLAYALSECTGMRTLKVRGDYVPGFLASLLRPSSLMTTLKVLDVQRYARDCQYRASAKDIDSKNTAMKKFGCAVQISN